MTGGARSSPRNPTSAAAKLLPIEQEVAAAAIHDAATSDDAFALLGGATETTGERAGTARAETAEPASSQVEPVATPPVPAHPDPERDRLRMVTDDALGAVRHTHATLPAVLAPLDARLARGRAMVAAHEGSGQAVPEAWRTALAEIEAQRAAAIAAAVAAEFAYLEAMWALDEHDARCRPLTVTDALEPGAVNDRIYAPASDRIGEIDPPIGGEGAGDWYDEISARMQAMAPGWDTENVRHWARELVARAVVAKYADEGAR